MQSTPQLTPQLTSQSTKETYVSQKSLPYDFILFDLDGTLIASEEGIIRSVLYALEQMGITGYKWEDLFCFIGPPLLDSFQEVIGMSKEEAITALNHYQKRYREIGCLENTVYTGIPSLLRSLKANGVTLGVATAKPLVFTSRILEAFGLNHFFDVIAAPRNEKEAGDKPALIRNVLPSELRHGCMVGDRKWDIEAGKACSLTTIGVLYGYGSAEELSCAEADILCQDPDALKKELLGDLPVFPGHFWSLEGPDGCGKSTQATLLADRLRKIGYNVVLTREPGGCEISERIRNIVLDAKEEGMCDICEALLFAASRAQHVHEVIRPAILRGDIVLCDRFVDSSMVYQGYGRGLGSVVEDINRPAIGDCMPEHTFFLDIDPHIAISRRLAAASPDRIEKENGHFVETVYNAYSQIAANAPERYRKIDANGSREEIHSRIWEQVLSIL